MTMFTHTQRVQNAIRCKESDRTCYQNLDGALIGRWYDPSFQPGDLYTRPEWAMDTIVAAGVKMGGDLVPNYIYAPMMAMDFTGIYYQTPGKDLPPDVCFQAIETNPMARDETVDFILENGVQAYIDTYVIPNWPEWAIPEGERGGMLAGVYAEKCAACGEDWFPMPVPSYGGPLFYSMSRGYMKYLRDIRRIPDKVKKISRMFSEWEMATNEAMFAEMGGLQCVFPAWGRFDNNTISPDKFDEFIWPETKWAADYAEEHDKLFIIHADGDFTETLNRHLHELPKNRTIVQLDGFTNVDRVADAFVKNQVCMYGEIPASMLTMGTPEDVYEHILHLKRLFGPGLILSAGCSAPFNTRLENVDAYIEAANTNNY